MRKKKLSIHKPKKRNFLNMEMFGYYLAGLIDSSGYINIFGYIIISFSFTNLRSAYFIKKKLKYGKIVNLKNRTAINLVISNKKGIIMLGVLIKNKLKSPFKIIQYNSCLVKFFSLKKTSLNSDINWNSFWFSGFFDGSGYFKTYSLSFEIRLLAQIEQKENVLLNQIKMKFGGYLKYKKSRNIYFYSSRCFYNIFNLLIFFDFHNLQCYNNYFKYIIVRKLYLIIQNNEHLNDVGQKKIKRYLKKLN